MSCMRCAGLLRTYPSVMRVAPRSSMAIARPAGRSPYSPLIVKASSVPPFSTGRHCHIGLGNRASRVAGGLLGGAWLAHLAADLGIGRFDGAWLVQNVENLKPESGWEKYANLFSHIDK